MPVRGLQRLFADTVGVSPKWVINRHRMLEAVDALNRDEAISLTRLAQELGYFDQAHFSRSFLSVTGHPPSHFRNRSDAHAAS
jgi:AraC-like DNA-binding protein